MSQKLSTDDKSIEKVKESVWVCVCVCVCVFLLVYVCVCVSVCVVSLCVCFVWVWKEKLSGNNYFLSLTNFLTPISLPLFLSLSHSLTYTHTHSNWDNKHMVLFLTKNTRKRERCFWREKCLRKTKRRRRRRRRRRERKWEDYPSIWEGMKKKKVGFVSLSLSLFLSL